jgi:hypothetical protein
MTDTTEPDPVSEELAFYAAAEELREKVWLVPVYDERGQRNEHDGQTRYALTPWGLEAWEKHFPERAAATPEQYAHLQGFLDRALRFDPLTRARYDRIVNPHGSKETDG